METTHGPDDDLLPEYDLSQLRGGVRGKYYERYRARPPLVRLDPDVAQAFPTEAAVNAALRMLADVARRQTAGADPA
jgi:hypothetical protein